MAERGAGELPRVHFRQKTGLYGGEIVGVTPNTAMSLAALLDRVLPQPARQCPRRVIERCAKVRKIGSGRRSGCRGSCDGSHWCHGCGQALIDLFVVSVLVMKAVCDASHFFPFVLSDCVTCRRK